MSSNTATLKYPFVLWGLIVAVALYRLSFGAAVKINPKGNYFLNLNGSYFISHLNNATDQFCQQTIHAHSRSCQLCDSYWFLNVYKEDIKE
jgi:hypothetical protein